MSWNNPRSSTYEYLTMAGLYKPSDSPASQAKFVDMYQTLNKDAQRSYSDYGELKANAYINNAAYTNPIDYEAQMTKISEGILNNYDEAMAQSNFYMGDPYKFEVPDYQMPEAPKPIESGVDEIADDATEKLDEVD